MPSPRQSTPTAVPTGRGSAHRPSEGHGCDIIRPPMPSREQILDEIRAAMAKLDLGTRGVDLATHLTDDLEFDSLDWLDLRLYLEESLGVLLEEEKLASVRTIGDVVEGVASALAEQEEPCTPS